MNDVLDFPTARAPQDSDWIDTPTSREITFVLQQSHKSRLFAVIRGGVGVGKSATLRRYADADVAHTVIIATLNPARRSMTAGLKGILQDLHDWHSGHYEDEPPDPRRYYDTFGAVAGFFKYYSEDGCVQILLIVDEAQNASPELLDAIRSIYDRGFCGVVLTGNHEFFNRRRGRMEQADFAALRSRCDYWCDFPAPTPDDIEPFLCTWRIVAPESQALLREIATHPAGGLRAMAKVFGKARQLRGDLPVRYQDLKDAVEMTGVTAGSWTFRRR